MLAYAANRPAVVDRRPHPNTLLFIIGGHVALLAAVMSAKMDLPRRIFDPPPKVFWVPQPKDPAPVTDTPSIALTSGLTRPSSVGPRLLKNSIVEFDVSVHDTLEPEKRPDAAADAEHIAPTATTLTGVPAASLCAATLRVGVL